jgi:hypothetical protein
MRLLEPWSKYESLQMRRRFQMRFREEWGALSIAKCGNQVQLIAIC